ncbi:SRPBCC domain-containing protein [Streptomyces sp. NPDC052236]|uniref:SRPBCC domain-containing protein n=1 Tax=Streptomyces sp. NPDC052236 TaxID=3365686 RepID=UPI0037D8BDF5
MTVAIPHGTSEAREGGVQHLHFQLRLPHPAVRVWHAVATPEGLPTWFAAADVLEPRVGGAVTLRRMVPGTQGQSPVAEGHVTAWDMEGVAEYTVSGLGRIRFHLEPVSEDATVLRFTNEFQGTDGHRLDHLADWHHHFELLADALDGRPVTDWSAWTPDRRGQLRREYE